MATPEYRVRAGFVPATYTEIHSNYTYEQLAQNFSWEDLAAGPVPQEDVRQMDIDRHVADVFNRQQIGRASVAIENAFGQYSPISGTSKIDVNQRFTVKAVDGSSIYGLFSGTIDTARVVPGIGNRVIEFSVSDRAKFFKKVIRTALQINTKTSSMFAVVLSNAGLQESERFIDTDMLDDIPFAWLDNISAGEALDRLMRSGAHTMYVDGNGKFHAVNRSADQRNSSISSHENFFSLDFSLVEAGIVNDAAVTGQPRKLSTGVNTVAWIEDNPQIVAGETLSFFLEFIDPNTREATRVTSLVTLVASQDYRMFSDENENGTNLTSDAAITVTPFATTALIEVVNNNSDGTLGFLTHFQLRGNTVEKQATFLSRAVVNSSINAYGHQTLKIETNLADKLTFTQNYAEFIVDRHKDPTQQIAFGLKNEFPTQIQLDMLSKVTLVESNTGISGDWVVRGIRDQLAFVQGTEHIRTFEVEKSSLPFFILDKDKLDDGKLGF